MTTDIQLCEKLSSYTVTSDSLKVYNLFMLYYLYFIIKTTMLIILTIFSNLFFIEH